MFFNSHKPAPLHLCLVLLSCFAALSGSTSSWAEDSTITLEAGQRLTLVLPDPTGADEAARNQYLAGALALAKDNGMTELQTFAVEKTLVGETTPQALGLYSWPSAEAARTSRNHPLYLRDFEPLRTQAWRSMDIIDIDLQEPLALSFDPAKTYTLAILWFKDKAQYNTYYQGTKPVRAELGVKTLLKAEIDEYDHFDDQQLSPSLVVLLEWPDKKGPETYPQSALFQQYLPVFEQAVSRIEWYQLGFWSGY